MEQVFQNIFLFSSLKNCIKSCQAFVYHSFIDWFKQTLKMTIKRNLFSILLLVTIAFVSAQDEAQSEFCKPVHNCAGKFLMVKSIKNYIIIYKFSYREWKWQRILFTRWLAPWKGVRSKGHRSPCDYHRSRYNSQQCGCHFGGIRTRQPRCVWRKPWRRMRWLVD